MIIFIFTIFITIAILLITVAVIALSHKAFVRTRLHSLSTASQCEAVGGVGISILCPSPTDVATVVNLLSSHYPHSEVVVALNAAEQPNLLSLLKIRYALTATPSAEATVYRSRYAVFRRLVVVATNAEQEDELVDLAARSALYDYLLRVPSQCTLLPYAICRLADTISAAVTPVHSITTTDQKVLLLSRDEWRRRGGFALDKSHSRVYSDADITEPLTLDCYDEAKHALIIERSRYNFWDFLSLNIMKYRNKLLSLKK